MSTSEEFLAQIKAQAAMPVAASPTCGEVVYIQSPQSPSRRKFSFLLIPLVALAIAYEVGISVSPVTTVNVQPTVASRVSTLPTAIVPSLPVAQPVNVIPQGEYHAPPATALPTMAPVVVSDEVQKVYDVVIAGPSALTPYPTPVCDKDSFVTDPIRVLNQKGMPIGSVVGFSCESEADAVASVQTQTLAIIAKDKLTHPESWK